METREVMNMDNYKELACYINNYHIQLNKLNELLPELSKFKRGDYDSYCDSSLDDLRELVDKLNESRRLLHKYFLDKTYIEDWRLK